ncbi:adenylosuccinate synthase [Candidatus Xianfuyuplasma coldseepsis]|uniref:Adenylosuccinate synthetase n=1 Tax=Candidatus Xianfuyuplasma coldseepsis TaxID=2782163 RepID=A0A7L7KT44_9MOLU|nr:adenylosuccinate synthase [Xianfuyuplasma coldseepsis]QMS84938.1 adenylosuccinate synthase [Xianfuyuplasma coldseepsis]
MKGVVVVGTQWGDEGKGKVTDFLAEQADVVVRFQGGNNAGHTIVFDGEKYALHLIPSGIFREDAINILANGMVINPKAALEELKMLQQGGITNFQLAISDRAHVVMPYHIEMDALLEDIKSPEKKVGTTKKGIGPTYTDKYSRMGIRVCDFVNKTVFYDKLKDHVAFYNTVFQAFGKESFDVQKIYEEYCDYAEALKPYVTDTGLLLNKAFEDNKKVLFEGAQGALLCIDHGTYPYVTSSSPTAASVPLNTGVSPQYITDVIGVTKAYSTRVGSGYFATEFDDDIAHQIREVGHEYGTTTGRPRRIGWLDTVVLRHTKRVSGLTGLSVMLLDVLTGIDTLHICTEYELDGQHIDYIPASIDDFSRCKPIYISVSGWKEDITKTTLFSDLPDNAQHYLNVISELVGVPIVMFSVGPDRTQTVVLEDIMK